jgi:hypothetical protein
MKQIKNHSYGISVLYSYPQSKQAGSAQTDSTDKYTFK